MLFVFLILLFLPYIEAGPPKPINRSLINFNGVCKCELGYSAIVTHTTWLVIMQAHLQVYNHYGCWCGKGGSGTPVDGIDQCCKTHDYCYRAARISKKCSSIALYTDMYKWKCRNKKAICQGKTECEKALCACDTAAVRCWALYGKPKTKKACRRKIAPLFLVQE
ncbi:unnamed protein product [Strongylus vulgaris]|uniref:phospholipase A2 n=1 Tax=Strongylus vulgaris TaxID=40348 RepID=A0A3P7LS63_STRVU|nr:unnamed protein product [Strongylus vulgaris]